MKSILSSLLIIFLNFSFLISQDTSSSKYFPLEAGNTWVYQFHYTPPPGDYIVVYKIFKDSVINNRTYYFTNFFSTRGNWVRYDSVSGNLVYYNPSCSADSSFIEFNFFLNTGDTMKSLTCMRSRFQCTGAWDSTIFGNSERFKNLYYSFVSGPAIGGEGWLFARNFGAVYQFSWSGHSIIHSSTMQLLGCVINNVVYGDTTSIFDIAMGPFLSIPSQFVPNQPYLIKAKVHNRGDVNVTAPIKFYVNDSLVSTTNKSLSAYQVDSITSKWMPTSAGTYSLKYISALLNDTLRYDDTAQVNVIVGIQDTSSLSYFPLQVGNRFFYKRYDIWQGPPTVDSSCIISQILDTSTHNGKKYYYITHFFADTSENFLIRYDSANGTLVKYDSGGGLCNGDLILFKLTAQIGDSIGPYCSYYSNFLCDSINNINLFNYSTTQKVFYYSNTTPLCYNYDYYKLAKNFGPYYDYDAMVCNSGGWVTKKFLKGGIINGLVYGDTSVCDGLRGIKNQSISQIFSLSQNYPNPFNPSTKIKFSIPNISPSLNQEGQGGFVTLKIYDILGREVATLVNEKLQAGTYEVEWDANNYPSGVYFYKLIAAGFTETKKLVLLK